MIYDCFLYFDEDMILDLRLNTLDSVVDKFVIVESTHTFTGKNKTLNFDINKFNKFKEKIIYIVFDESPDNNPWDNEAKNRNAIMRGLAGAEDDDLILISDIDEIFKPQAISKIKRQNLCTILLQNFYNYQFNLQVFNADGSPRKAGLAKAVSLKNLRGFFRGEPETVRNVKRKNSTVRRSWLKWKWLKFNTSIIKDGGWHFSWIMTAHRISEKMSSISHTEYDTPEFNNPDHIMKALSNAEDIWGRERNLVKQALTKPTFPDYLVDNKEQYKNFIV